MPVATSRFNPAPSLCSYTALALCQRKINSQLQHLIPPLLSYPSKSSPEKSKDGSTKR